MMKKTVVQVIFVLLLPLIFCRILFAQNESYTPKEKRAQKASEEWLSLVDKGDYAASWQETSENFKSSFTKKKWVNSLENIRRPLGKVLRRALTGINHNAALPGSTDSEYIDLIYETSFAKHKNTVETITVRKDKDRQWRVIRYHIR